MGQAGRQAEGQRQKDKESETNMSIYKRGGVYSSRQFNRRVQLDSVYYFALCFSNNRSERRDRSMKKLSEYFLGRPMSGALVGGADLSGDVAAVERHEIVDGSAEAGRALTAEVASRGSGAVAGGGVVIRS